MDRNDKADLKDLSAPSGEQSMSDVELSDGCDDLAVAIKLLEPGKPLVVNDGFVVTDNGNMIVSQYVDIGVVKLRHRPAILVKSIESDYGLEHARDIQLSAPFRFHDYGETLIQDDQEGHAQRETKTESPARSYEEQTREQEKALSLLGHEGVTIKNTETPNIHRDTDSMTFGRSSWIYCTSIETTPDERSLRRTRLPFRYDHESVIRQPRKFARALGEMFADQRGPQGHPGNFTHAGGIQSFHDSQLVLHGPVWYTDDVFEFLESRRSDPLYHMYALFVKHSDYRDLGEYRFVLNCRDPIESETLRLYITGAMRDALAPPRAGGRVTFQSLENPGADSSSPKVSGPTPTHKTMTQTRTRSARHRRTLRIGGEVAEEETITSDQTIVLTTRLPADGAEHAANGPEASTPGEGEITESETRQRRIAGSATDKMTRWQTRILTLADASDADKLFSIEERDHVAKVLDAVGRPFANFSTLPQPAAEALISLARQGAHIEPQVEVQVMSACWNGIWAICNLYEFFGDIVASVGIEHNEFVAITLKRTEHSGAEGKILVGPRGTFAYVLTRGDEKRPGYGGANDRLIFFPDEEARTAFEEFGWTALQENNGG